uniref:Peptidase S9 prolyl oligopeptidase catalytic domain-containing protein n=1 Tax=Ditylenchus dipsaci TaxID=166011 RepID=A0A915EDR9_9BILA
MRITVCLTARSDGKKFLPYVLVHRKRPVPKIIEKFKGKLIINWNWSVWTTADYLKHVSGGNLFSDKRLLVWDAFAAHKIMKTIEVLKQIGVEAAFIPGDDPVVPYTQSQICYDKLKERGITTALKLFPGESHGFKSADAVTKSLDLSYVFLCRVLDIKPSVACGEELVIVNQCKSSV